MLTDIIAKAKLHKDESGNVKAAPYKLSDEKGLYLLVQTSGGKLWRFDYRFNGKRKTLALGAYPDISLAQAREKRDNARKLLANDTDPDSTSLTSILVLSPTHGTVTLNSNGSFTYVPTANYNGLDSFTYRANDGLLDSNIATVKLFSHSKREEALFNLYQQLDAAARTASEWIRREAVA